MKLLFLACVFLILLHTSVTVENRVLKIQLDFNRVVNKIKNVVEKL